MALSRVLISQAAQKLSADEVNYLKIIERNGKNLLFLINDILDLAKIEAGRISLRPIRFSIGATLESILERLAPIAEEKDLTITRQIDADLPPIESDEIRVHQILQNLIGNAVKFTLQGGVTVRARCDGERVHISVSDTGIGIPEAELPHIFEEFKQVDGTSARAFDGTGLGLAIAYKSARLIRGDLTVQSTVGSGSTFSLTLPVRWGEPLPATVSAVASPRLPVARPASARTVLIVDDEPEASAMLATFLSSEGYHAISAASGEEALRMVEAHRPHAILLDVIMPEMDGWEVLQQLKAGPDTRGIPVIIISKVEGRETGFAMGAISYVQKPVSRQALMSEIRKIEAGAALTATVAANGQGAGRRILVVEDNEVAMAQVKHVLEMAGYLVDTAQGGQEALDYIRHTIPDAIVLDLMMPEMDGFEVLDTIHSQEAASRVPVLVLTAKDLTLEEFKRLKGKNIKQLVQKGDVARERLLSKIRVMLDGNDTPGGKRERGGTTPSILVVEDHSDSLLAIRAVLGDRYLVLEATDGEKGLEMALSGVPDLILLDISLPKMDGLSVVRRIKADESARRIPVIALTASAMKGDREKILSAGCDDYIAKPVDAEALVQRIDHWLGR
jgi:CheY-like chemotaxis protein